MRQFFSTLTASFQNFLFRLSKKTLNAPKYDGVEGICQTMPVLVENGKIDYVRFVFPDHSDGININSESLLKYEKNRSICVIEEISKKLYWGINLRELVEKLPGTPDECKDKDTPVYLIITDYGSLCCIKCQLELLPIQDHVLAYLTHPIYAPENSMWTS